VLGTGLAGTPECDIGQPLGADLSATAALCSVRIVWQRWTGERSEVGVAILLSDGLRFVERHWAHVRIGPLAMGDVPRPLPPEASPAGCLTLSVLVVSVDLATLDTYVSGVVCGLLATKGADLLAPTTSDSEAAASRLEESELLARLDALAEDYAAGTLTRSQMTAGTERIRAQLAKVRDVIASAGQAEALAGLVGAEDVAAVWEGLDVDRRRAVIEALFDGVVIARGRRGARAFDPARILFVRHGRIV
jgi:hypothetical protein